MSTKVEVFLMIKCFTMTLTRESSAREMRNVRTRHMRNRMTFLVCAVWGDVCGEGTYTIP